MRKTLVLYPKPLLIMSKRVALYVRVSSKQHQTVENQSLELKEFCKNAGWDIVKEYANTGSGASSDRKSFNKMLSDAHKRKFDILLFWSLDRFSREGVKKTTQYLQLLESNGIAFKSYTEQYIDSTGIFKDVIISLLATLAKQERIRLSERVRAGLDRAKKEGRIGGRPTIDNDTVIKIRKLKEQSLSDRKIGRELGISPRTVAKYYKDQQSG